MSGEDTGPLTRGPLTLTVIVTRDEGYALTGSSRPQSLGSRVPSEGYIVPERPGFPGAPSETGGLGELTDRFRGCTSVVGRPTPI